MKNETTKLFWVTGIIVALIGGGLFAFNASQSSNPPTTEKPLADQSLLMNAQSYSTEQGTRTYSVTIVGFGDYECPACGFAAGLIKKVVADNPQVRYVFRNFPLEQHPFALIAAEAAEAAGAQGKFWEMHEAIYLNQDIWSKMQTPMDAFVEMAKQLNLDVERFKQEVTKNTYASRIEKDRQDGDALKVNATPTFYINGEKYNGGLSYDGFKRAIDEAGGKSETQQQ